MSTKLKICLVISLLLVSVTVYLDMMFEPYSSPKIVISISPDKVSGSCHTFTENNSDHIDNKGIIQIAAWNIYKQQKNGWQETLLPLLNISQLVLLQEAHLDSKLDNFIKQHKIHIAMAQAFSRWDIVSGVMNLSKIEPLEVCAVLTKEPIIRLPKSALVASYDLSNGQQLMVINVHSVNFSWDLASYQEQLESLSNYIGSHNGPVIMAGDFNTWRKARLQLLDAMTDKFGLREAIFFPDDRIQVFGYKLDHIYYRGLTLNWARSMSTNASDHNPMLVQFALKNP